jgi:hypothetical protein
MAWQAELAAARGGVESLESVVVLSTLGRRGDICAPTYDAFVDEALPVIVDACTQGTGLP